MEKLKNNSMLSGLKVLLSKNRNYVCKLKKALYGLKQAPRAWFSRLDNYLMQQGYRRGAIDSNLYIKLEKKYNHCCSLRRRYHIWK